MILEDSEDCQALCQQAFGIEGEMELQLWEQNMACAQCVAQPGANCESQCLPAVEAEALERCGPPSKVISASPAAPGRAPFVDNCQQSSQPCSPTVPAALWNAK